MLSLRQIFKKIEKLGDNRVFNFNKYAKNKLAYLEEEELGVGLTPLEQFDVPELQVSEQINPSITEAMQRYIDQNAHAEQMNPMPQEWISNISLRVHFQNLAEQVLGNMADAFVGRAMQATEIYQESTRAIGEEEDWSQYMDFDIDLVQIFFQNPDHERALTRIAKRIQKSQHRGGVDIHDAYMIASEAVKVALGAPALKQRGQGSFKRDQRFNFFLSNSDKMPSHVQNAFSQYKQKNSSSTIDDDINFLKVAFGEDLLNVLQDLVRSYDSSILSWITKQEGHVATNAALGRSLDYSDEDDGYRFMDEDIASLDQSRIGQREKSLQQIDNEKDALLRYARAFGVAYLQNVAEDMNETLSDVIERAYESNKNNKSKYNIERMDLFNKRLLEQLLRLSEVQPRINSRDGSVEFRLDKKQHGASGKVSISTDQLSEIFNDKIDISLQGQEAEKSAIDLYDQIKNNRDGKGTAIGFQDWFSANASNVSVLPHTALYDSYKDAYELKTALRRAVANGSTPEMLADKPETHLQRESGGNTGKIIHNLDSLSNAKGDITEAERKKRRLRYINMAISPEGEKNYQMYKNLVEGKIGQGEGEIGQFVNSAKPYAQYDLIYIIDELNKVRKELKDSKKYSNDMFKNIFKAYLTSISPYSDVRNTKAYKEIMGEDQEFDIEGLDSASAKEYEKIMEKYSPLLRAKQSKQEVLNKAIDKINAVAKRGNEKILKILQQQNKNRNKEGLPEMTAADFVGVADWTGSEPLPPEKYNEMYEKGVPIKAVGKNLQELSEKIDRFKYHIPTEKQRGRIGDYGLEQINERFEPVRKRLEEFKAKHGWTDKEASFAEKIYQSYRIKLSAVNRIKNRYINMKIACDMNFINDSIKNIKKDFYSKLSQLL